MSISEADALANLHTGDITTNLADTSNTLVAEGHSGVKVVLISTTEAGVTGLNVNLVGLEGASGLVGHNLALFGATEDLESDAHFVK